MLNRAVARPLALVAVCLATAAGCGEDATRQTAAPASSGAASTASTPASSPAASTSAPATSSAPSTPATTSAAPASPSSAPTSAAPTPAPRGPLGSRLLAAGEVPGFNDQYRWRPGTTTATEPRTSAATCQRFGLTSIGAEKVAVRSFTPASGGTTDRAVEQVAAFPDEQTARRAYAVLTSWRAHCADRLRDHRRSHVGGLETVAVPTGTAGWYLLTYGPVKGDPDSQFFDAQGMALVGSRIATVSMVLAGQDYNYEAGHEPMVAAVQRAARKLT